MMNWKACGKYIDRTVRMVGLSTFQDLPSNGSLSSSILLLCFEDGKLDDKNFLTFLEKVVSLGPLAIVVAGRCVEGYFDGLLDFLDKKNGAPPHIMTGVNESPNVDDWLSVFLQTTWPAEERFDSWKEYAVIAIGDSSFQEFVYSEVQRSVSAL